MTLCSGLCESIISFVPTSVSRTSTSSSDKFGVFLLYVSELNDVFTSKEDSRTWILCLLVLLNKVCPINCRFFLKMLSSIDRLLLASGESIATEIN